MKLDRENKLLIGLCTAALIIIGKLFSIQILDDDYKMAAENNSLVYNTIYPTRGIIHDRNGNILVGNKVFKVRISGHACSVSGPLVYAGYFLGVWAVVGAACWGVILWASLVMKRHTLKEFIFGTLTCLFSFTVGWLIFH